MPGGFRGKQNATLRKQRNKPLLRCKRRLRALAQPLHGFIHGEHFAGDLRLDVAGDVEVMVVGGDLVEGGETGDAFDIGVVADPAMDALDVLGKQFVLGATGFELFRGIDDEHLVFPVLRLLLSEDEDAGGEAGAVEEIWSESDDGLQQVHAEDFSPNLALLAHAEKGSVREDDGHAPGLGGHGFDHVLDPRKVPALAGWHAGEIAAIRIAGPDFVAPFL